jgi:predicted SAM-dependent methyltransferase
MGMIQQFERLEQQAPDGVRTAVWSSLRVPHFVVRRKVVSNYLASHTVRKLQVGCGGNILSGWLNSDLNPVRSMGVYLANLQEAREASGAAESTRPALRPFRDVIYLDATKTLPFPNNTFDYVFSEHMIEHIPYQAAMGLIKEIYRVVKPGGRVRVSTPDLSFLINLYTQDKSDLQLRYITWATDSFLKGTKLPDALSDADTFVINNFVRNWGHQFIYDQKTLWNAFAQCGFSEIERCNPGVSVDENLRGIESHGRRISDDFNQLESIVVEAVKPTAAQHRSPMNGEVVAQAPVEVASGSNHL